MEKEGFVHWMFVQASIRAVVEVTTLNSPSRSPRLEETSGAFSSKSEIVMTGLFDEGTDGPLVFWAKSWKLCTKLEPHSKFHIPI